MRAATLEVLALALLIGGGQAAGGKTTLAVKETPLVKLRPKPAEAVTTQFDSLPWGYHLSWSPDMRRVVYWATANERMFLVADGVPGQPFDITDDGSPRGGLEPPRVTFSPDSRHFVYQARRGSKSFLVMDGKESKPYDAIRDFCFSPDFAHSAFVARRGHKYLVVRDGEEGKLYAWIAPADLHWSADSRRMAYWAKVGKRNITVLHDGASVKEIGFEPKARPSASGSAPGAAGKGAQTKPHGEVKSISREGKDALVVNGVEGRLYDFVDGSNLAFGPDGQHFAYHATRDHKQFIVVDGVEAEATYSDANGLVLPPLVFDGPDRLHTLALRGEDVLRVEVEITEQ